MKLTSIVEQIFKKYLPSPFTLAVLLTLFTLVSAVLITKPEKTSVVSYAYEVFIFWEKGIWNQGLLVFAYQMMLVLVLGHVLVLSESASHVICKVTRFCNNTARSAMIVSFLTMLVAFFNWGLGLIFGALLARKVAERAHQNDIKINYPIVGAAGYVGLMVWHGGISGSAPLKINETGHLKNLMSSVSSNTIHNQIPEIITFSQTVFSWWNLFVFILVVLSVSATFYILGKYSKATVINLREYQIKEEKTCNSPSERLDQSKILALGFGALIILVSSTRYWNDIIQLKITPNFINFMMLGFGIILHGSLMQFSKAVGEAISDISGILIQFPLYFGIMGVMTSTGMVLMISDIFTSVSTARTLPVLTFFSAGLVNIFVPSGGGQWVVQGPVIIESALKLGVPLPKVIMALAYGDQITNMMQPFWALPLLGITRLKAREILPYTLIAMGIGSFIYVMALIIL